MQGMLRFANSLLSVFSLLTTEEKKKKKHNWIGAFSKTRVCHSSVTFVDIIVDANIVGPIILLVSSTETDLNYTQNKNR